MFRELRDFRQRYEKLTHELKRKEMQIKELQSRLDSGEGCEYASGSKLSQSRMPHTYP